MSSSLSPLHCCCGVAATVVASFPLPPSPLCRCCCCRCFQCHCCICIVAVAICAAVAITVTSLCCHHLLPSPLRHQGCHSCCCCPMVTCAITIIATAFVSLSLLLSVCVVVVAAVILVAVAVNITLLLSLCCHSCHRQLCTVKVVIVVIVPWSQLPSLPSFAPLLLSLLLSPVMSSFCHCHC